MSQKRPIIVFAGPSLDPSGLPDGLEAELRHPAAQGDLVEAVRQHGKCVIALIDGLFQGVPAVRHKEILWAMDRGAVIFGASSMGALRAAELASFGMHGRGLIYRWLRRYPLLPDDAVAVLHAPPELDAAALTEALVDLRRRFAQARRDKLISGETAAELSRIAENLHYTKRTLANILSAAATAETDGLADLLSVLNRSQKAQDACLLLIELRDRQQASSWPEPEPAEKFVYTDAFLKDLTDAGFSLDTLDVHW
ncbi:TfuA-like protein [uncultured Roseibium sp.]|uniref:TfuA-like protein n=1 Tax=uncultured Roseibium sp. TaxID=1936171 RepID=UPI002625FE0D|nr:TfuA-like protein [uncultured Roseibium sp.]